MNMKKNTVAITPVVIEAAIHFWEMARNVRPTPESPMMMPLVPSLSRNLRPFLSTSVQATIVISMFITLMARSEKLANAPWSPVSRKIVTV